MKVRPRGPQPVWTTTQWISDQMDPGPYRFQPNEFQIRRFPVRMDPNPRMDWRGTPVCMAHSPRNTGVGQSRLAPSCPADHAHDLKHPIIKSVPG